jgi:hypothetical protein
VRALLAVLLVIAPATAAAERCAGEIAWIAETGTVSPGARCGTVVLTTDGRGGAASTARARLAGSYGDVTWSLRARRLGGDESLVELAFSHGYVMLKDGQFGVYLTEAQWQASGWQARPTLSLDDGVTIAVALAGDQLSVTLDGEAVGTWTVDKRSAAGVLAVWVRGPRGVRTHVKVSDVSVSSPGG